MGEVGIPAIKLSPRIVAASAVGREMGCRRGKVADWECWNFGGKRSDVGIKIRKSDRDCLAGTLYKYRR